MQCHKIDEILDESGSKSRLHIAADFSVIHIKVMINIVLFRISFPRE